MGDVFRGLAVGFSSTPFQTPAGAIGKARDPKLAAILARLAMCPPS